MEEVKPSSKTTHSKNTDQIKTDKKKSVSFSSNSNVKDRDLMNQEEYEEPITKPIKTKIENKMEELVIKEKDQCVDIVGSQINETHGSLGCFKPENLNDLLADDFLMNLEDKDVNKEELINLFIEWSKMIESRSEIVIHAICKYENFNTVLAHWETK